MFELVNEGKLNGGYFTVFLLACLKWILDILGKSFMVDLIRAVAIIENSEIEFSIRNTSCSRNMPSNVGESTEPNVLVKRL